MRHTANTLRKTPLPCSSAFELLHSRTSTQENSNYKNQDHILSNHGDLHGRYFSICQPTIRDAAGASRKSRRAS